MEPRDLQSPPSQLAPASNDPHLSFLFCFDEKNRSQTPTEFSFFPCQIIKPSHPSKPGDQAPLIYSQNKKKKKKKPVKLSAMAALFLLLSTCFRQTQPNTHLPCVVDVGRRSSFCGPCSFLTSSSSTGLSTGGAFHGSSLPISPTSSLDAVLLASSVTSSTDDARLDRRLLLHFIGLYVVGYKRRTAEGRRSWAITILTFIF